MDATTTPCFIPTLMSEDPKGFRLGVLLYAFSSNDDILLIKRTRKPNQGCWCAVGGKLEFATGESPYECAIRETKEEIGVDLEVSDLDLRCIVSEKDYEGSGHWLMFVFVIQRALNSLPDAIDEGMFGFFDRSDLERLSMPDFDRDILRDRILNAEAPALSVLSVDGTVQPIEESLVVEQEVRCRS